MSESPEVIRFTLVELASHSGLAPDRITVYMEQGLFPSQPLPEPHLFSAEEIPYLQMLERLQEELEVNLPGIEVILHMRQRLEGLQAEVRYLQRQLLQLEQAHVRSWHGA